MIKLSTHCHSQQAHPSKEFSTYQTMDGEKRTEDNRGLLLSEIPARCNAVMRGGGSTYDFPHKKLQALLALTI